MEKDTYGSKLRNLLTPYYNMVEIIRCYERGEIECNDLINIIKRNNESLYINFKRILEMSYDDLLDKTEYNAEE